MGRVFNITRAQLARQIAGVWGRKQVIGRVAASAEHGS